MQKLFKTRIYQGPKLYFRLKRRPKIRIINNSLVCIKLLYSETLQEFLSLLRFENRTKMYKFPVLVRFSKIYDCSSQLSMTSGENSSEFGPNSVIDD